MEKAGEAQSSKQAMGPIHLIIIKKFFAPSRLLALRAGRPKLPQVKIPNPKHEILNNSKISNY